MKRAHAKLIKEAVESIDWKKIMYFHNALNIQWQIEEDDGNIIERAPSEEEVRDELQQLLKFAVEKNLKVLDYGNWIVYWSDGETTKLDNIKGAVIEIIFSSDSYFVNTEDTKDTLDDLNKKMRIAIEEEDYESAALLRDKIKKIVHNK